MYSLQIACVELVFNLLYGPCVAVLLVIFLFAISYVYFDILYVQFKLSGLVLALWQ